MEMNKRITLIDQIRGFAMFGVLLVNLTMMENLFQMHPTLTTGAINVFFEKAIDYLAVGKFYTMFSILFGLGFYLFMEKSGDVLIIERLFKRRLSILFVFGILHLIFGWSGDILHVYAIGGFFLLSKRNMPVQLIFKKGISLFLVSVILIVALTMLSMGSDSTSLTKLATYDETIYLSVVSNRVIHELPYVLINLFVVLPRVISLFLLGYGIGKMQILNNVERYFQQIKKTFYISSMFFFALDTA